MVNTPRKHFVTIGPPIEMVPVSHFSKTPPGVLEGCWQIVGPSVNTNMQRREELWSIFAACYWEGLSHGVAILQQQAKEAQALATGPEPEKLPVQAPKISVPVSDLPLACLSDSCYYEIFDVTGEA